MSMNPARPSSPVSSSADASELGADSVAQNHPSRRAFLAAAAAGLAGASVAPEPLAGAQAQPATSAAPQDLTGDGRRRRILLRGGVVLTPRPQGRRLRAG